jgi:hypothetical protein
MGLDIGGSTINSSGSGIAMNTNFVFNSSGYGTDLSTSSTFGLVGYSGWKDISGNDTYYSATTGWPINNAPYNSGHINLTTGVFTCPVAGYYAVGFNGITNGGSWSGPNGQGYGYAGFAKNGAMSYFIHFNVSSSNAWNQGGGSSVFSCAAGDTLALFINRSPSPVAADSQGINAGWYPHNHHAIWCKLIG